MFIMLLIAGCTGTQTDTIDIGAIYMLTGTGATWGLNSQNGANLAVEEINDAGGVNGKLLRIIYEDNQGDNPKAAVSAYHNLKRHGIEFILGTTWSPSGVAVAPLACEDRTAMISSTLGVAEFNEECDYLFNLWPHDEGLSEEIGRYAFEQGHERIAILGSRQLWEQQQAEAVKRGFENAGGEVAAFELPEGYDRDIRTELLRIKESDPDAVVFTNQGITEITAVRLRELGLDVPFYSVLIDHEQILAANGALEGTTVISSLTPTEAFKKKYERAYNDSVDIGADTSYDAVMLLARAMEATGSEDPEDVKEYLNGLTTYTGASGNLTFDGKGGVTKRPLVSVVRGDRLVQIG